MFSGNHFPLNTLDGVAIGAAVSDFFGWLPETVTPVTSILSLLYLGIRLYETKTVQRLLKRR